MKQRFLVLALGALLALTAACGSSDHPAATVNGDVITDDEVLDELRAIAANDDYVRAIESSSPDIRVLGEKPGSYNSGFVAEVLRRQIGFTLIEQEIAERKLELTDECRAAGERDLENQLGGNDASAGRALLDKFPADYREQTVVWTSEVLLLQGALNGQGCVNDNAVEQYYDEHKDDFRQVCVSHILVTDEALANDLYAQLQAGADFAELAAANSTDSSAADGGSLGCVSRGAFVPEFEAAAFAATPGEVTEPVQTQFGWHLILVDHFQTAPLDDVRSQVEQQLANSTATAFNDWLDGALSDATITIDPAYGSWDDVSLTITPPPAPETTTTAGN